MISRLIDKLLKGTIAYKKLLIQIEDMEYQNRVLEKEQKRYERSIDHLQRSLDSLSTIKDHTSDVVGFLKEVAITEAIRDPSVIEEMKNRRMLLKDMDYLQYWDSKLCDAKVSTSFYIMPMTDTELDDTIVAKTTIHVPSTTITLAKAF